MQEAINAIKQLLEQKIKEREDAKKMLEAASKNFYAVDLVVKQLETMQPLLPALATANILSNIFDEKQQATKEAEQLPVLPPILHPKQLVYGYKKWDEKGTIEDITFYFLYENKPYPFKFFGDIAGSIKVNFNDSDLKHFQLVGVNKSSGEATYYFQKEDSKTIYFFKPMFTTEPKTKSSNNY